VISKSAALRQGEAFRSTLARALRLAFFLTIPSTIGLVVLARPIIQVLYQRGKFTPSDTIQTADVLQFYTVGLVAYSGIKVLAPAFYAIGKKNTPMIVSLLSIVANLLLNWVFTFQLGLGQRGLALSTGLVAVTNFLFYYLMMRAHSQRFETGRLLTSVAKILVAALAMGVLCWVGNRYWISAVHGFLQQIFALVSVVAAGVLVYSGATFLLRMDEVRDILSIIKRRFSKRPQNA
jgi:putative peptidoglycan lipid II flippase